MMSKKYHKKIAEIIGRAKFNGDLESLDRAMIRLLSEDNPRFDASEFVDEVDKAEDPTLRGK